jgi:outer membrane protein assembly factor BamB
MAAKKYLVMYLSAICLSASCLLSGADWPTFAHDPQRTGWASEESTLAVENVRRLELKWSVHLKNEPHALNGLTAPLTADDVTTTEGIKNVVYVAGSSDHVFALDAVTGKPIWNRDLEGFAKPKSADHWICPQGITATPTIDKQRGIIFVIASDGRVFGLDLGTGKAKYGPVQFVPPYSKSWSLNLVDGTLYTSLSQGCAGAQNGIYSLNTRDPKRPTVRDLFLMGGIWGRGGPVVGDNGKVFGMTSDAPINVAEGNFGSSVVAASLSTLEVVDYYTPTNWKFINRYDLDLASASPVWFRYKNYNLLAGGGKEGVVYLMDADALGDKDHHTPLVMTPRLANDQNGFEAKGIWGALSFWTDTDGQTWIYVPIWGPLSKSAPSFPKTNGSNPNGSIMAFKITQSGPGQKPSMEPAWISGDLNVPEPVVIANGVIFTISTGEDVRQSHEGGISPDGPTQLNNAERVQRATHAVLYALDAKTGKVLYDSGNSMTTWVHFSGLAVANGQIFAVDRSQLYCFGLKGE